MINAAVDIVAEELEDLKKRIIANMRNENAVASGRTIKSLTITKYNEGARLWSNQSMPFGVMETGRKGGDVPSGFRFIIQRWMKDKGVHADPMPYTTDRPHKYTPQERADRSMAYLIARKIKNEGTKLNRMKGRKTIYSNEIPTTIERIKKRIGVIVSSEVVKSITNNQYNYEE